MKNQYDTDSMKGLYFVIIRYAIYGILFWLLIFTLTSCKLNAQSAYEWNKMKTPYEFPNEIKEHINVPDTVAETNYETYIEIYYTRPLGTLWNIRNFNTRQRYTYRIKTKVIRYKKR